MLEKTKAEYRFVILSLVVGYKYRQITILVLSFSYPEHLGSAFRAYALGGRLLVLHLDLCRVLDFHLFPALHAVSLHWSPPTF